MSTFNRQPVHKSVEVVGGPMAVAVWEPLGELEGAALMLHGRGSNHVMLDPLARAWDTTRNFAPDLRGYGRSRDLPGPYGLLAHVDDLVRLLDAFEVDSADIVGHSMGGAIGVLLADRHPDRVRNLVLVDGGFPLPRPDGVSAEQLAAMVLGPTLQLLSARYTSPEDYREVRRKYPVFTQDWNEDVERYVDYDLIGEPPTMHPSTNVQAVTVDVTELITSGLLEDALERLSKPTAFLPASRGLMDEEPGLYSPARVQEIAALYPSITIDPVPDTNHVSVVMGQRAVEAITRSAGGLLAPTG